MKQNISLLIGTLLLSQMVLCWSDSGVINFTYDNAGRLIQATHNNGGKISYTYDANGNPLSREIWMGGGTYSLIYLSEPQGFIQGMATQTVAHAQNGTPITAVTNLYQRFLKWSDGRVENPRIDTNINANLQVVAQFNPWLTDRGTPYWWLAQYKLNNSGLSWDEAESSDVDRDGGKAWQEYVADTNPTNAASSFRVLSLQIRPHLKINFDPGSTNRVYSLYYTDKLIGSVWTPAPGQSRRLGVGSSDYMIDTNVISYQRYYRLHVELP